MTTLALSDHDAVAGVPEAAAAAARLGVELVPAVEMSCVHEYAEDLHICGYWVDLEADRGRPASGPRGSAAPGPARSSRTCGREGFDLTLDDAIREAGGADSIGPPTSPAPPAPAATSAPSSRSTWSPAPRLSCRGAGRVPEQAIELIRGAGGAAVIAHPYWDGSTRRPRSRTWSAASVRTGSRPSTRGHSEEQTRHLLALCEELAIAPTASSDYHGPTHKTFAKFGAYETYGLGAPQVPPKP